MGGGKGQGGAATTMNTPLQSYDELVNRRSELIKVIHTHLLCVLELFCVLCACVLLCDSRPTFCSHQVDEHTGALRAAVRASTSTTLSNTPCFRHCAVWHIQWCAA
jgi:hypothetical protein